MVEIIRPSFKSVTFVPQILSLLINTIQIKLYLHALFLHHIYSMHAQGTSSSLTKTYSTNAVEDRGQGKKDANK
jgi:hypothetical protein